MDDSIKHGAIVRIVALKARSDLNGTFAIVLPPETAEERSSLEDKGRVKVSCFPNTLSLKKESLQVLLDREVDKIDWSYADFALPGDSQSAGLLETIRHAQSKVGCLNVCHDFGMAVWNALGGGHPMPPKVRLIKARMNLFLNNTAGHHVYILCLDQIGHHIVLETRAGMARFFQSFIKISPLERWDPQGFSGREWVTGKPDPGEQPLPPGMLKARTRWNVPHNLHREALHELLNLLFELQDSAQEIANKMMTQLPPKVQAQHDTYTYQAKIHDGSARHIGGATSFAKKLFDTPIYVTSFENAGSQHIVGSPFWHGEPFHFEIPADLAMPFERRYKELTGHTLQGASWMKPLLFKDWQTEGPIHDLTGQPEAHGWSFIAATIPH